MTMFCGQKFSNTAEVEKLIEGLRISELPAGAVLVDIGTAHGFYAIAAAKKLLEIEADALIIAVDFSKKMLRHAVRAAEKAGVASKILFVLADVEHLPLSEGTIDRVTCGGSLNEYQHPDIALEEICRVLKRNAIFYAMNLHAIGGIGGFFQKFEGFCLKLTYHSSELWSALFSKMGLETIRKEMLGSVMFSTTKKP